MEIPTIGPNPTFNLFVAPSKPKSSFNLNDVCIKVKDFVLNIFYTIIYCITCCKKDLRKIKAELQKPVKLNQAPTKSKPIDPVKPGPIELTKSKPIVEDDVLKATEDLPVGLNNALLGEDVPMHGGEKDYQASNILFQKHIGKENACELTGFNKQCLLWSEICEDGKMIHTQPITEFDQNCVRERLSLQIDPNGNVRSTLWGGVNTGFCLHNSTFTRKVISHINKNFLKIDQQIRLVPISYFKTTAHKDSSLLKIVTFIKKYQSPANDNFFTHKHIAEGKKFGICPSIAKERETTTTLRLEGRSIEDELLSIEYDIEISTGALNCIRVNKNPYANDGSYPETEIWLGIITINLDRYAAESSLHD